MIRAAEVDSSRQPVLLERAGEAAKGFRRVITDSQQVRPGDLFVALRGEHHDGHDFLADALARGARGLLIERLPAAPPEGGSLCRVKDTLGALARLGGGGR